MAFAKSGNTAEMERGNVRVNIAGENYIEIIQVVGVTEEALIRGDVATNGYIFIENLDVTNFVSIRAATGLANLIRILPGKTAGPFMLEAANPFAIANTAPVKIRYLLIEA